MKELPVIFENEFCLVFNKPAGLPVQGGEGVKVSLDSLLEERYSRRIFLVHRLDRDTSGLILTAKTKEAAASFSSLFERGLIKKRYLAVSAGTTEPSGVIRLSLEIRGRSLRCETSYRLLSGASLAGFPCSLLELELGTGRMHQIRRHLSAIGHPVLGDDKYGDFSLNKNLRKNAGIKRLLLHAYKLSSPPFPPCLDEGFDLESPLPDHFTSLRLDNGLSFFP